MMKTSAPSVAGGDGVSLPSRCRLAGVSLPSRWRLSPVERAELIIRHAYITVMFLQPWRYESGQPAARGAMCRKQFYWCETGTVMDGWRGRRVDGGC